MENKALHIVILKSQVAKQKLLIAQYEQNMHSMHLLASRDIKHPTFNETIKKRYVLCELQYGADQIDYINNDFYGE